MASFIKERRDKSQGPWVKRLHCSSVYYSSPAPITSVCGSAQSILKNSRNDSWKLHYWDGYFKLLNFIFKNSEGCRTWPLELPLHPHNSIRILFANSGALLRPTFISPTSCTKTKPSSSQINHCWAWGHSSPSESATNWPEHLLGLSLSSCPRSVAHSGNRNELSYDSVQLNILCNYHCFGP